jgi:tRNA G37 N-methylase TrmD
VLGSEKGEAILVTNRYETIDSRDVAKHLGKSWSSPVAAYLTSGGKTNFKAESYYYAIHLISIQRSTQTLKSSCQSKTFMQSTNLHYSELSQTSARAMSL